MMVEGSVVTIGALAWLFLKLAHEGELRQRLLEEGTTRGRSGGPSVRARGGAGIRSLNMPGKAA